MFAPTAATPGAGAALTPAVPCTRARCHAASIALVALSGALFGAGLIVAGMTRPDRVIAFLDPLGSAGPWDPGLAFVMAGAVAVYSLALHRIRARRAQPLLDVRFHLPTRRDIDPRLVAGAALFGAGWGLAGLCPGPGIVGAAAGAEGALAFVLAMLAGMYAHFRFTGNR